MGVAILSGFALAGLAGSPGLAASPSSQIQQFITEIPSGASNAAVWINESGSGTALTGTVGVAAHTGVFAITQACDINEEACSNIASSARSYQPQSGSQNVTTGDAIPVSGKTYRACTYVTVSGTTTGGCTPIVFQGGHAFLSSVQITVLRSGLTTSTLLSEKLNGQAESAQLATWICDGHGNRCSIIARRGIQSFVPPQQDPGLFLFTPHTTAVFGHTYKACAIEGVPGTAAAACSPLVAF